MEIMATIAGTYSEQLESIITALQQLAESGLGTAACALVNRLQRFKSARKLTGFHDADQHPTEAISSLEECSM